MYVFFRSTAFGRPNARRIYEMPDELAMCNQKRIHSALQDEIDFGVCNRQVKGYGNAKGLYSGLSIKRCPAKGTGAFLY